MKTSFLSISGTAYFLLAGVTHVVRHNARITCTDRTGLIATITAILYKYDLNIVVMKEYVDRQTNGFFARCEFTGDANTESMVAEIFGVLPPVANVSISMSLKKI